MTDIDATVYALALSLGTMILMTLIYFHLYKQRREKALAVWAVNGSMTTVGYLVALLGASAAVSTGWAYLVTVIPVVLFTLWGTLLFLNESLSRGWIIAAILCGILTIAFAQLSVPSVAYAMPASAFISISYLYCAIKVSKNHLIQGSGKIIASCTFFALGAHAADFPFLAGVSWFTPWGFLIAALLAISLAVGILLIYFNRVLVDLSQSQELAQSAKKEAEAASRAKSDFLASLSHELRTPLNSVLGFAQVLQDSIAGPVSEEQQDLLSLIRDSGEYLLSLVNTILDISKIEAGKVDLNFKQFSLRTLLENIVLLFSEKAARRNISLTLDMPADVDLITADELRVKQVIVNLLANALKFTPEGGDVGITTRPADTSVELTVWDTGAGIPRADLPRLFQPFQQAKTPTDFQQEGTGLGLYLCKQLVELHGGRIWVESEQGAGTQFSLILPREPIRVI